MDRPAELRLERYTPERRAEWDAFVAAARNGVFLFRRGYMDYHANRFTDHSLLARDGDRLVAVLPASERDGVLSSHGGLTFGGFVTDDRMTAGRMVELFALLRGHLRACGLSRLVYKAVPHIYHRCPAEEDLYALFAHDARLVRRDVAATVRLAGRVDYTKGRRWSTKKARANGLDVGESADFAAFMDLEAEQLAKKYGVRPVHTAEELALLASRFPENVRLHVATKGGELLGGVVVYAGGRVAHAQYIATSEKGRELGALDRLMDVLLNETYAGYDYFDFGVSTEKAGRYLNAGLMANKESYGGRSVVYDFYELDAA